MSNNKLPSLASSLPLHFVIGVVVGAASSLVMQFPSPPDAPVVQTLLTDVMLATVLACTYYFLFRGPAADVKQNDVARTGFARTFFCLIGIIIGIGGGNIIVGHPLSGVVSLLVSNIVLFAITYRKLLKLYRDANMKSPGGSERPD